MKLSGRATVGMSLVVACVAASSFHAGPALADDAATPVVAPTPPPPSAGGPILDERAALSVFREKNLTLLANRYELSQARAHVVAAGVLPNPSLSLGANFQIHGPDSAGLDQYSIGVQQPLPVSGVVGARKRTAEALESSAERDFLARAWDLSCDVRELYLAAQVAEARVKQLVVAMTAMQQLELVIDRRASAGANPVYDRLRVQVEVRKLDARRAQAENEVVLAHANLEKTIGQEDVGRAFSTTDLEEPALPTTSLEDNLRRALGRPDLAASRYRVEAARLSAVALRKEYFPTPTLSLGYSLSPRVQNNDNTFDRAGMIGAGIAFPLPVFDHGQGAIEERRLDADKAQANARQLELGLRHDLTAADFVYRAQIKVYQNYRDTALADAIRMRSIAELSYREGRASILELVDAYNAYSDAYERGVELRADAVLRGRQLQRIIGPQLP